MFAIGLICVCIRAENLDSAYKLGLKTAKTNILKSQKSIENINPNTIFKDFKPNSSESKYYQGIMQSDTRKLRQDSNAALLNNEASKAALNSTLKHPEYFVNSESLEAKRSAKIIGDAAAIASGTPLPGIDCKETRVCNKTNIIKTCNEVVRPSRKICDKTPSIKFNKTYYHNCIDLILAKGGFYCPSGFSRSFYVKMTEHNSGGDVNFCTRPNLHPDEHTECFTGSYYIAGAGRSGLDQNIITVPKHLHASIKVTNVYGQFVLVTIIDIKSGKKLHYKEYHVEGDIITLPFSESDDQSFKFYINKIGSSFKFGNYGIITSYIKGSDNKPNITWEETCREF